MKCEISLMNLNYFRKAKIAVRLMLVKSNVRNIILCYQIENFGKVSKSNILTDR